MERLAVASLINGDNGAGFSAAPIIGGNALNPRFDQLNTTIIPTLGTTPTRPGRRRLQQSVPRLPLRRRATGTRNGFTGAEATGAYGGGSSGAASIAVSADRAVHITSGVVAIYSLDPKSGARVSTLTMSRLQDIFAPVGSSNCKDGVYDAQAAFDPQARRFYVTATCGATGSALLAVSAAAEPFAAWYLYNLPADGVATRLACANGESSLADYPRLNFNTDALAISVHSYCPSAGGAAGSAGNGATLLVVPKGAVSKGETRIAFAVFTSYEVAEAASGNNGLADSIVQLEPAVPQFAGDVAQGTMYFVADVSGASHGLWSGSTWGFEANMGLVGQGCEDGTCRRQGHLGAALEMASKGML